MSSRLRMFTGAALAVAVIAANPTAQKSAGPRTREGRLDLQGTWSYATLTPLERPPELAGQEFLTAAQAAEFEQKTLTVQNRDRRDGDGPAGRGSDGRTDLDRAYNQVWWEYGNKVVGTRRTSLIIEPADGRIPPLTPEGLKRAEDRRGLWTANGEYEGGARGLSFDSHAERPLQERCLGWTVTGPPMVPGAYNNNMALFQTADTVVILNEMVHEHRIIPLDGRPQVGPPIRLWMGSSRGRWVGDTLVVDTTNFRPTVFRSASATLHLVERFTRVGADALVYEFTVDDPATWVRPWTVQVPMRRTPDPIFEYACHEGNYSLMNILAGARAQERSVPAAGQRGGAGQPQAQRAVTIAAIPGVVAAGAEWKLVWQGTNNADGLVGTSDGGVLFAQEQPNQVSKLDRNDQVSVFLKDTHGAGSLAIDSMQRILAVERTCTDPGRQGAPCTEPTKITMLTPARKVLVASFDGKPLGRLNDLVVDRKGGVYFTSGGAFYADPRGQVSSLGDNIRANGIMLSRDENIVYVTNGPTVLAFDIEPDGSRRNRRDFGRLDAGGNGDGMAIDAAGRLYVTSNAGVQVLGADGKYLGNIPTPRNVISVAFAGPDKTTLYVVGSGALGPDGQEFVTPDGVRNNAKTIYKLSMLAQGFTGRSK